MRMCWVKTGQWSTPFTQYEGAGIGATGLVWYGIIFHDSHDTPDLLFFPLSNMSLLCLPRTPDAVFVPYDQRESQRASNPSSSWTASSSTPNVDRTRSTEFSSPE